jgi:hypothetical protein
MVNFPHEVLKRVRLRSTYIEIVKEMHHQHKYIQEKKPGDWGLQQGS